MLAAVMVLSFIVIVFIKVCISGKSFFSVKSILQYYMTIFEKPQDESDKFDVERPKIHYQWEPIFFNFVFPIIFGIILGVIKPINNGIVTFMSTVVSIWIAILFALIAVIQSLAKEKLGETFYLVVKQAYATVMFECCISVFTVVLSFSYVILCPEENASGASCVAPFVVIVLHFLSVIIYSLLFILFLTMFMIFKKCNALLGEIIKSNELQKRDVTLINILKSVKSIESHLNDNDGANNKGNK